MQTFIEISSIFDIKNFNLGNADADADEEVTV